MSFEKCVTLGRGEIPTKTNGYFDSEVVSRIHAKISFDDSKFWITDFSKHGVCLNGNKVEKNIPTHLNCGDLLSLGAVGEQDGVLIKPIVCFVEMSICEHSSHDSMIMSSQKEKKEKEILAKKEEEILSKKEEEVGESGEVGFEDTQGIDTILNEAEQNPAGFSTQILKILRQTKQKVDQGKHFGGKIHFMQ